MVEERLLFSSTVFMELLKFIIKIIHLLEGRVIGVVTLMNFKLLMLPERLVTALKVALFRKLSCH